MSVTAVSQTHTHLADETLIDAMVDVLCDKMLDDYRVNRFLCSW